MKVRYNTALGVIFGVKKYAAKLLKVIERKDIELNYKRNMVEVDAVNKTAIFDVLEEDRQESYKVSPPLPSSLSLLIVLTSDIV